MFPFRLFPTNFSICIMPPLGMLWHSPFSPALTSSSEIQAISGKHFNSVGPSARSFPTHLQLKKDKKAVWGSEGWNAHGKWAENCWNPPPLEAPGGNQLEDLQIQKQMQYLIVDSGLAAKIILSGAESAGTPHPFPPAGVFEGER